jgi:hypothetical protein
VRQPFSRCLPQPECPAGHNDNLSVYTSHPLLVCRCMRQTHEPVIPSNGM